jgi:7-cyano-7-deazaguanine synthase
LAAAPAALSEGFGQLALGIHKGSHYYDASLAFVSDAQRVFDGYFGGRIIVTAPLLDITKPEIWQIARAEGLPVDLTYSCLEGSDPPCGCCPSCKDREALIEDLPSLRE